jgi:hypothetical protein
MEDVEGFEFRVIVTGEYRSVRIDRGRLVVDDDHYLNGSIFTVRNNAIICSGQTLVMNNNSVMTGEGARVVFETHDVGLLVFKCGDSYLNQSLQFQSGKDRALVVQIACIDPFDDYQPPDNAPDFIASPFVSADGVPLLTSSMQFCFNIVGETCSAVEDQSKLIFNDDNYTQGFNFNLVEEDGDYYIKTSFNHKYLGIVGNSVVYLDERPQHNIALTAVRYPSMFVIGNGSQYYKVTFFKSNYGELIAVDDMAKATPLQFISV